MPVLGLFESESESQSESESESGDIQASEQAMFICFLAQVGIWAAIPQMWTCDLDAPRVIF